VKIGSNLQPKKQRIDSGIVTAREGQEEDLRSKEKGKEGRKEGCHLEEQQRVLCFKTFWQDFRADLACDLQRKKKI